MHSNKLFCQLTISPAQVEVLDIDIFVRCCLPLTPEQETFLGSHLLHGDVLDGEPGQDYFVIFVFGNV